MATRTFLICLLFQALVCRCETEHRVYATDLLRLELGDAVWQELETDSGDAAFYGLDSEAREDAEPAGPASTFGSLAEWEEYGSSHALLCTNNTGHHMTLEEVGWLQAAHLSAEITLTRADGQETVLFSFELAESDGNGEVIRRQPCTVLTAQVHEEVALTFTVFAEDDSVLASVSESFEFLPARAGNLLWRVGLGPVSEEAACPTPLQQALSLPENTGEQAFLTLSVGLAHEQYYPGRLNVIGLVFGSSLSCVQLQPLLTEFASAGPGIALSDPVEGGCYSTPYGTFAPLYMPSVASAVGLAARLVDEDQQPEGLVAVQPSGKLPDTPPCGSSW